MENKKEVTPIYGERPEGMDFEVYKLMRAATKKAEKEYLKGQLWWDSNSNGQYVKSKNK